LLWRFPKLEVPFAVRLLVSSLGDQCHREERTHFDLGTVGKKLAEGPKAETAIMTITNLVGCGVSSLSLVSSISSGGEFAMAISLAPWIFTARARACVRHVIDLRTPTPGCFSIDNINIRQHQHSTTSTFDNINIRQHQHRTG
jgi:hypothetical protein